MTQDADLAKKLSNPIASLVSVPFQFNYDSGYGPSDGHKAVLNIQPVIPFELNDDWNVISRTIVPVTSQDDIAGGSGSQFGLGNTLQSFFFSPKESAAGGLIWGAGPAILISTATEPLLGGGSWGSVPQVFLEAGGTMDLRHACQSYLVVAGDGGRADISSTFLQPFASYTTHDAWTFTLDTESTYDWKSDQWSVPINFSVSKLVTFDKQPVSFQVGARYWAESPEGGPQGWGVRARRYIPVPHVSAT